MEVDIVLPIEDESEDEPCYLAGSKCGCIRSQFSVRPMKLLVVQWTWILQSDYFREMKFIQFMEPDARFYYLPLM